MSYKRFSRRTFRPPQNDTLQHRFSRCVQSALLGMTDRTFRPPQNNKHPCKALFGILGNRSMPHPERSDLSPLRGGDLGEGQNYKTAQAVALWSTFAPPHVATALLLGMTDRTFRPPQNDKHPCKALFGILGNSSTPHPERSDPSPLRGGDLGEGQNYKTAQAVASWSTFVPSHVATALFLGMTEYNTPPCHSEGGHSPTVGVSKLDRTVEIVLYIFLTFGLPPSRLGKNSKTLSALDLASVRFVQNDRAGMRFPRCNCVAPRNDR